jgi:hypothetical protein
MLVMRLLSLITEIFVHYRNTAYTGDILLVAHIGSGLAKYLVSLSERGGLCSRETKKAKGQSDEVRDGRSGEREVFTVNHIRDDTPESINDEFPSVSSVINDFLKVVSKGRIVQYLI